MLPHYIYLAQCVANNQN